MGVDELLIIGGHRAVACTRVDHRAGERRWLSSPGR